MEPLQTSYRGYVYLIGSSKFGWYKIGKSKRAEIRITDIGILLPFKIEVFAVWGTSNETFLEAEFHRAYANDQINGEWFGFEKDFVHIVIEYGSIYPSTLIYRYKNDGNPFVSSNIPKDRELGQSRAWKMLTSAAWLAAKEEWLIENGLEPTKTNKKLANKAIRENHDRYLRKLYSLQQTPTMLQH